MKKLALGMIFCLLLCGCTIRYPDLDRAAALRSRFLGESCSFDATVTADYGEALWTFSLDCRAGKDLSFTVTAPEEIAGIRGRTGTDGASLLYDGQALGFPLLADGLLSPAGAPWVLVQALRRGCFRTCQEDGTGMELCIDDRYEDKALTCIVRFSGEDIPTGAEILWEGRRILTLTLENFHFESPSCPDSIE